MNKPLCKQVVNELINKKYKVIETGILIKDTFFYKFEDKNTLSHAFINMPTSKMTRNMKEWLEIHKLTLPWKEYK